MTITGTLKKYIRHFMPAGIKETEAETAYDLWAGGYDHQPLNLMLALDKELFSTLIKEVPVAGQQLIDIGCGTGRHWYDLLRAQPARLVGYDVSRGMLARLKEKFPSQEIHRQTSHLLDQPDNQFDILFSTLTVAHIENIEDAIREWYRVLRPGGTMILTDYHPATLKKGGQRTFSYNGKTVAVKNHVHPVPHVIKTAVSIGMELEELIERNIDESMRGWYESQHAMAVYEKFRNTPVIYGCRLKKKYAAD